MRKHRGHRSIWLLVATLLVLVGACGSDDDATADVTTTTSAPATTTTVPPTTTTTVPPTTTTTIASPAPIPIEAPEGMELVWNDEFDGDTINAANWTYDIGGWGWGNGESQYYTDRPENVRLQNGLLVIEGRQEQYEDNYYTSTRLKTQGLQEFQYGYLEARIKVPDGAGMWPAFWMLGANFGRDTENPDDSNWPNVGEIDIMEFVGKEPILAYGNLHGPGYSAAGSLGQTYRHDGPIPDEFHTYAVEWDSDGIRWFFDGEQYGEKKSDIVGDRWVFDQPFFFILNLALGGSMPGPIGLDVEFPKYMYVDHVRVYQPAADQ
jgi:beta-glucanase (GH16 family)